MKKKFHKRREIPLPTTRRFLDLFRTNWSSFSIKEMSSPRLDTPASFGVFAELHNITRIEVHERSGSLDIYMTKRKISELKQLMLDKIPAGIDINIIEMKSPLKRKKGNVKWFSYVRGSVKNLTVTINMNKDEK